MARDYYGTLGVRQDATSEEIKRAYRKLARELHPDVNPDADAQQRFRDVTAAYEVLSDPQKRKIVDMGGDPLENGAAGGGMRDPFAGFGLSDIMVVFAFKWDRFLPGRCRWQSRRGRRRARENSVVGRRSRSTLRAARPGRPVP